LTDKELIQFFDLLKKAKSIIQEKYSPDAFNIGINEGEEA
jgi:diadenosine tetraphosphate (Ap4A) HIT family hydrolase